MRGRCGWGRASSLAPSVFEIKTCSLPLLGASEDARPQPHHATLREHADRVGHLEGVKSCWKVRVSRPNDQGVWLRIDGRGRN